MGLEQLLRTVYTRCGIRPLDLYALASKGEDGTVELPTTRCPLIPADPDSEDPFDLNEGTEITTSSLLGLVTYTLYILNNITREQVSRNQFFIIVFIKTYV